MHCIKTLKRSCETLGTICFVFTPSLKKQEKIPIIFTHTAPTRDERFFYIINLETFIGQYLAWQTIPFFTHTLYMQKEIRPRELDLLRLLERYVRSFLNENYNNKDIHFDIFTARKIGFSHYFVRATGITRKCFYAWLQSWILQSQFIASTTMFSKKELGWRWFVFNKWWQVPSIKIYHIHSCPEFLYHTEW